MSTATEGSNRLDRTLASESFAYKDSVSLIVKNQLLKSSLADTHARNELLDGKHLDELTQYWSSKIWTFLEDLRGASAKHTGKLVPTNDTNDSSREWKLKDESDRYRVMYREGPVGTPFHTLCLDGAVDGDFTSALCVAWECPIYKEWWPQFMVPTFKITESKWLRRIRVGEDLSLLRFKVPWPLAQREVLLSAFALECLEEDLVIGLIASVPDGVDINEKLLGFSADDLPPLSSIVRMDIGGGFVMQRTAKDKFFFRTIMNIDMKLDFVPPWLINFVSRQVAGQGLKLYQKAVLAASNGTGSGKAFQKPLKGGILYTRIRSGLEAKVAATGDPLKGLPIERLPAVKDSGKSKSLQGSIRRMGSSENNRVAPYPVKADKPKEDVVESSIDSVVGAVQSQLEPPPQPYNGRSVKEVRSYVESSSKHVPLTNKFSPKGEEEREYDDPDVEWALNILDKMILFTRACAAGSGSASRSLDSQVENASSVGTAPESGESHAGNRILPPVKNPSSNGVLAKPAQVGSATLKSDNRAPNKSPGWQVVGGDTESSGVSSFWSASEIEIVSSQDDTDTDVGRSGGGISQPKVEESEVDVKHRRRKWRWTCFSPSLSKKHPVRGGRSDFYARDSGRASEGHWKSLMGESDRFTSSRGYLTDGEEVVISRGRTPDRSVTLGELLRDDNY